MPTHPLPTLRLAFRAAACALAALTSSCVSPSKPAEPGKLYHLCFVWLKEPGNAAHQQKIIDAAHAFAREIPEVEFLSVGKTLPSMSSWHDATFDVCIVMRLEDTAALDRYSKHAVHEKAAQEAFLPLSKRILFYDFISE